jgi:hypothetical protein
MANILQEIMSSKIKHKEQVEIMTEKAKSDEKVLAQLFEILRTGADVESGDEA